MRVYSAWAFFKIVFGSGILYVLYNYINIFEQPVIGLWFWFLGLFILVRWLSYFIFLGCYKLFSTLAADKQSSSSYKLSLLLGLFVMVNLTLMIVDKRTNIIWITVLVIFCILQVAFTHEQRKSY